MSEENQNQQAAQPEADTQAAQQQTTEQQQMPPASDGTDHSSDAAVAQQLDVSAVLQPSNSAEDKPAPAGLPTIDDFKERVISNAHHIERSLHQLEHLIKQADAGRKTELHALASRVHQAYADLKNVLQQLTN